MARLSIKRFAREIGLSVGTVSAALNGLPSVKAETAEYVRRKALEYGYAPNPWARKMQDRASRLFALVLPHRPTNLTNTLTQEILDALRQEGFASTVYYVDDAAEVDLYRTPADGFMLVSSGFPKLRAALETREIPYLVVDPRDPQADAGTLPYAPAILLDRHAAAREAADLLHDAGCTRFLFGGDPEGTKYDGYVQRIRELTGSESVVTVDAASGLTAGGDHIRDIVLGPHGRAPGAPPGIWVAGLRDMAALVRVCDRSGIEIGRDLYSLYWGAHFYELPGFDELSYIGEPTNDFFAALIDWAHDPQRGPGEPVRVRLQARIRASVSLSTSTGAS
jgi:DNA-binding LacI/PurR family transcriptional regulator